MLCLHFLLWPARPAAFIPKVVTCSENGFKYVCFQRNNSDFFFQLYIQGLSWRIFNKTAAWLLKSLNCYHYFLPCSFAKFFFQPQGMFIMQHVASAAPNIGFKVCSSFLVAHPNPALLFRYCRLTELTYFCRVKCNLKNYRAGLLEALVVRHNA
jgi:hypothetical protein